MSSILDPQSTYLLEKLLSKFKESELSPARRRLLSSLPAMNLIQVMVEAETDMLKSFKVKDRFFAFGANQVQYGVKSLIIS
jgi:hypothetical protein